MVFSRPVSQAFETIGADMRTMLKLLAPAFLLALTACNSTKPEPVSNLGSGQTQMAKQFKFQKTQAFKINYLLFLPQDYDANPKKRLAADSFPARSWRTWNEHLEGGHARPAQKR